MKNSPLYEDFNIQQPMTPSKSPVSIEEFEDQKLASFENGYSSGWDDAICAHKDGKIVLSKSLKDSIERAELTRKEALNQFSDLFKPLIHEVISKIFPDFSSCILAQHIKEILNASIEDLAKVPVCISVSRPDYESLRSLTSDFLSDDVSLEVDLALDSGQVCIALGQAETIVDLAQIFKDVSAAVDAFYHLSEESSSNDRSN